ncbi:MAG: hypothetical protein WC740_03385 [Verrucomicrobiia bacterium]
MNPEQDLEKWTDRELRPLPAPRAPETLAPRVMAAIAARAALPWYRQTWFEWSRGWQAASAVVAASLLAAWVFVPWQTLPGAESLADIGGQLNAFLTSAGDALDRATRIALPLWNALVRQFLIYATAVAAMLVSAVIALGGAARQIILKETQP